jgi:hypothetical protein
MRVQADHVRAAIAAAPSAEVAAERGEVVAAGRALRACHDALVGVDGAGSGLEPLGMLREAARLAVRAPTEVAAAVDRAWWPRRGCAARGFVRAPLLAPRDQGNEGKERTAPSRRRPLPARR